MYAPCIMLMLVNGPYGPEVQAIRCQPPPSASQPARPAPAGYGQVSPFAGGAGPLFAGGGGCSGGSVQFAPQYGGYPSRPVAPPAVRDVEGPGPPQGYGAQSAPPYQLPGGYQYAAGQYALPYSNGYGQQYGVQQYAYGQGQPAYQAGSPCPVCVGGR